MIQSGIIELDLHNMNVEQAKNAIDKKLLSASKSLYKIRLIHGFNGGTAISQMIREEYSYGRHDKVIRITAGTNRGITELILREL